MSPKMNEVPHVNVLKEAADSLGILPETGMERAKGVVLVEGKSDITFLRHAARSLKEAGFLHASFEDTGIVPILIGGCGSVKHWVTLKLADDLGLPWCVFLDSDIGGEPSQVKSIQKRRQEVETHGKAFYATRKREIENYLCPEVIKTATGADVVFTDTCDAKKIIGSATNTKPDDVIDKFWPLMPPEKIIQCSIYRDGDNEKSEIKELVESLLNLNL